MHDFDTVVITDCKRVTADNVFMIMIFDFHKIIRFTGGSCRKLHADLKCYKPFSFFNGATPENGYKPTTPYTIAIYENPYSFDNENWATLWVKSGGGDNMRSIKLRKKPSTGQWFLNEIQCLSDIRVPASEDPWA